MAATTGNCKPFTRGAILRVEFIWWRNRSGRYNGTVRVANIVKSERDQENMYGRGSSRENPDAHSVHGYGELKRNGRNFQLLISSEG